MNLKPFSLLLLGLMLSFSAIAEPFPTNSFPNRLKTEYFNFYFNCPPKDLAQITRFSDAYIHWLKQNYFDPKFKYPIGVVVLNDTAEMQKFIRDSLGVKDPPGFGIYFPEYRTFFTRKDSGLGTFAHEILHPLVEANLPRRPNWSNEGIPTFFEKFYGYYSGSNLVMSVGYQNPWRIKALGENLPHLDLQEIVSRADIYKWSESDLRLVTVFLWEQGKLKDFIRLIQANDKKGQNTFLEAALGTTIAEIRPQWEQYTKRIYNQRAVISQLPPSLILPDRKTYEQFAAYYHLTNFMTHAQLFPEPKN